MKLLAIFSATFVISFSGAAMPGPLLTVTIKESHEKGFWAGPLLVLGHGILELLLIAALMFGLKSAFESPFFVGSVGLLGGGFLFWMGIGMIKEAKAGLIELSSLKTAPVKMGPVMAGALVSVSNPYWTIWWATIGLGFVLAALKAGPAGLIAFYAAHILADLAWYSLVSFMVSAGKSFISDRAYRAMIGTCAIALMGLAAHFISSGFQFFTGGAL